MPLQQSLKHSKDVYKGKVIQVEEESDDKPSKFKMTKEMEEELSLKTTEYLLAQDLHDNIHVEADTSSLHSILSEELKKQRKEIEKRFSVPRKFARVYLRRKPQTDESSKCIPSETVDTEKIVHLEENIKVDETPKVVQKESDIPKSTPMKKFIPKIVVKKHVEIVEPDKEKYKKFYEGIDTSDFTDRDIERMVYLVEHGFMWEEIFKMSVNQVEDSVQKYDVYTSGYDTQKVLLEAKIRELDATKLKPNVNVKEVSKEIYPTNTVESSVKVSAEKKSTWYKKQPKSSRRMVYRFDEGIENFSRETLNEKIISWR
ncbi:hypothetical protein L1987_32727 [Smallanthus sonchifolius]|uniref:Uncharacterized protein n=1 Tax=Smallanthus sonchifolius TaxID=185202 RepID=A0ACB9HQD0_9ASTR|nr:hypothetical protein L1987_32727 [Smallanthus sonchifolius]